MVCEASEVIGLILTSIKTRHHAIWVVRVIVVRNGSNDSKLIETPSELRKVFANPNTGQRCRDGAEFTTDAFWSVGFRIKGVDVARPAKKIDEDHSLGRS